MSPTRLLYRYSPYLKLVFLFWDLVLLNFSFLIAFYIRFPIDRLFIEDQYSVLYLLANIVWIMLVFNMQEHKYVRIESSDKILSKTSRILLLHFCIILFIIVFSHFELVSRLFLGYFFIVFSVQILIFRIVYINTLKYFRRKGYNFRNVVILGANKCGRKIESVLSSDIAYGYRILGYFDHGLSEQTENYLGPPEKLKEYCIENSVHEIYVAGLTTYGEYLNDIISFCESNLIRLKIVPDFERMKVHRRFYYNNYEMMSVFTIRHEPLESPINRIIKRLFDLVFSLLVLVLICTWLFPIIMLLIVIDSKGPVFFTQIRSGINNRPFVCYKFRTMVLNGDADKKQASTNDPRITRIGRFLRKSNLDEMPQFLNVLFGHMSVIGPRPHMLKHTEEFSVLINEYPLRHYIRPGISGWAQVYGFRGETTDNHQLEKRVEYDIWYMENWSILLDFKIIYLTLRNMIIGDKNAY